MTNYEKIKSLDISELAKFIDAHAVCDYCEDLNCVEAIEEWLKMDEE